MKALGSRRWGLLASVAAISFIAADKAQAETVCSQAADGSVECVDGSTVVASGSVTPNSVIDGVGLQANDPDLFGTMTGNITTTSDGADGVSLGGDFSVGFTQVGLIATHGNGAAGLSAYSFDGFVSIHVGDVSTSGAGSVGIGVGGFESVG